MQYENNKFVTTAWKDLQVGRFVKVLKNEQIPVDLLVIYSSADNGFCYLQTTNLDGESALKSREAVITKQTISFKEDFSNLEDLKGEIQIDKPNNNIYVVDGNIVIYNKTKNYFDINNVILRVRSF